MAYVGERWRTKDQRLMYRANVGERLRTLVNYTQPVLKTTWTYGLTVFFSPLVSQTYLRRTGGICAPESARGRHPEQVKPGRASRCSSTSTSEVNFSTSLNEGMIT